MKKYIITTLENKPTRGENVRLLDSQLSERHSLIDVIIAPDWRIFQHTSLNPEQYRQQSLTLAYYNICMRQLYWGLAVFVIMEDDLHIFDQNKFTSHLFDFEDSYHKIGAEFGYLSLTDANIEGAQTEELTFTWNKVKGNYWETPATIWTQKMARIFVDHISEKLKTGLWLGHIDHELQKIMIEQNLTYLCPKSQFCAGLSSYKNPPVEFDKTGSISEVSSL